MPALSYFNPFENLLFNDSVCFLTGNDIIDKENEFVYFFPEWVMDTYNCRDRKISMMNPGKSYAFKDLKLPCSLNVKKTFEELDKEVFSAFQLGYEGIKALNEEKLFIWIGKIVYGMLYYELQIEKEETKKKEDFFGMHKNLRERFSFFHLMLQSIINPIEYGERKPWSVSIVKLKYSGNYFNFKDDSVNLLFSLGVNGFGIILLMQDNGLIKEKHNDLLKKIGEKTIHSIQFEELCAHYQYSNYLLQYPAKYVLNKNNKNQLHIECLPITQDKSKPLFNKWENQMFAKVLANYWKPWGIEEKNIIKAGETLTFLENQYTYELINPESIKLPY